MSRVEGRLRDALAAEAAAWPAPGEVRRTAAPPSRKRWVVAAVAAVAAVSVAATWLLTRDVTEPTAVACFREVDLDSDRAATDITGDLDANLCAPLWADGPLVNEEIVGEGDVPPLTACVSGVGSLWVFPTDDAGVCEELGLAVPTPESMTEGNEVRRLTEDLIDYFDEHDCRPLPVAAAEIREILDDSGFADWEIKAGSPRPDRPCASLAVDSENKTIGLVPIPDL